MAAPLVMQLAKCGRVESPTPNVLFSVEDPNSVWIVSSGILDLFTVATRNGDLFGARHHVLRIEEGDAVFGVGSHLQDAALVASASPETQLLCLSLDHLLENGNGVRDEDSGARLLETWIMRLTTALSEDVVHGPFLNLDPGNTIKVPEQSKAIVPREGVVWVKHNQGKSHYLSNSDLPAIDGRGFFPVTRHGWLQAEPESEIYSVDSNTRWHGEDVAGDLREFHVVAMSYLATQRRVAAKKEHATMQVRVASDTAMVQTALLRLTSIIRKIQDLHDGADTCRHPVFLACEVIGKKLNIKMKPHPDMLRGVQLPNPVASIARATGIRVRNVALKGEWWKGDSGPLLAFREKTNSPLALLPLTATSYEYYDPVENRTAPLTSEIRATLNPFASMFYRAFPAQKLSAWDLLRFGLFGSHRELLTIVLMGVAAGLTGIITPYATGVIFDRLIPGAERSQLVGMAFFLLVIAVATTSFNFARSFAVLRLEGMLDASIQAAVWDRLLSLPVSFFRDYSSGDLAQRSLGIAIIRQTLTGPTLTAILSGIFSVFSFVLLFYYSWSLALLATGLVGCAVIVSVVCGIFQVRRQRQMAVHAGRISSMLLQFITGIAKFRISGTERRAFAVWAREFARLQQTSTQARVVTNSLTVFISVFPMIALAAIFLFHQTFTAFTAQISTGDFLAFLAAFIQFLAAALMLSSAVVAGLGIIPIYERAKPIFQALPEVTEIQTAPGRLTGAIEVSRISFRYKPDAPQVLRDVSVKILPGQFVAFVGASGCGKSTLFRMLLGFEAPESGAVYYDGHDLSGLDIQAVRQQIGVVLQSSRPVSGSIFHNIVGSAPLSMEDAWEAARLAGIDEDIKRMPMNMHTHLGDGGGSISGGQRQRLMIARAIVGRPRILLFDEATSALDNHTQAVVSRSLENLQATRVVIAHRLSTIIRADNIFVMDKGVLVDSGTYEELIAHEGIFRDLAKRQMT
jgi:NHLM bacteriocin system ABC transporter ATP-binding protein